MLFGEFDLCSGFSLFCLLSFAVLAAPKLWKLYLQLNHTSAWEAMERQKREEKERKQRMAAGIGMSLLRIFFGGR